MKDIRLSTSFWDHWKTVVLKADIGYPAIESLQRLWCFAAINKPDGTLTGMTIRTIEIAAHWAGESGAFVGKLVELHFLDAADGVFCLHDWAEHNGWAAHAKERSEQGKKGAAARWSKKTNNLPPNGGNKNTDSNAASNAASIAPGNAPTPTPTPTPTPIEKKQSPDGDCVETAVSTPAPSGKIVQIDRTPYAAILDAYHGTLPELRTVRKLTPARQQAIRNAWRGDLIGSDLTKWQDFFAYVRDCCPFLTGRKPGADGRAFQVDLEWLMKPVNLVKVIEGKYEEGTRHG
jgi:hypothetical protein